MTQENKELLLKDLCARLSYGIYIQDEYGDIVYISYNDVHFANYFDSVLNGTIKPYLFPLSSMTEEQFVELKVFADLIYESDTLELVEWNDNYKTLEFWLEEVPSYCVIKVFDWLNKNHFDYRDLISKGLAIDATGLNIY